MKTLSFVLFAALASCSSQRTSPPAPAVAVRLRVINNATCDVQLRVLQYGAWQKTVDVPSLSTREAVVALKGLEESLTYRVTGSGCRFAAYDIPASSITATDIDVIVADVPTQAVARVRVR